MINFDKFKIEKVKKEDLDKAFENIKNAKLDKDLEKIVISLAKK